MTRFLSVFAIPFTTIFIFAVMPLISANAQTSAPRMESDSRPSVPSAASPTATPAPTLKPSPTAAKPAATPTSTSATPPGATATPKPKPSATPTAGATTNTSNTKPTPVAMPITSGKFPKVVTKLKIDDLQNGRGRQAKPGAKLVVHFTSWLYDPTQPLGRGPQFESTNGKTPYKFTLQNPETPHIRGWEEGLIDMKSGGKRRLIIPADLAYGMNGAGQVIPPGATLLYEIELLDVE